VPLDVHRLFIAELLSFHDLSHCELPVSLKHLGRDSRGRGGLGAPSSGSLRPGWPQASRSIQSSLREIVRRDSLKNEISPVLKNLLERVKRWIKDRKPLELLSNSEGLRQRNPEKPSAKTYDRVSETTITNVPSMKPRWLVPCQ